MMDVKCFDSDSTMPRKQTPSGCGKVFLGAQATRLHFREWAVSSSFRQSVRGRRLSAAGKESPPGQQRIER
jgi:hypothetical protein